MKIPRYEHLTQELQLHLHALELREAYHSIFKVVRDTRLSMNVLHKQVFGSEYHNWTDQVEHFIKNRTLKQRRRDLVIYYLVAGVGINQICRRLRVGQVRVEEVRDSILSYSKSSPMAGVFLADSEAINNLQYLLDSLNVMDGFRVTKPERARHNPFIELYKSDDEKDEN